MPLRMSFRLLILDTRDVMKFSLPKKGFTLIEVLVACAVLAVLLVMLLTVTTRVSDTWRRTTTKMQAFEGARAAFDTITATLAQATLNTYWDYNDPNSPTKYERHSELHFLSSPSSSVGGSGLTAAKNPGHAVFFQAPTGIVAEEKEYANLPNLLNVWGFFVEFGSDEADVPDFLNNLVTPKYRYRLKQWQVPSEYVGVYATTSGNAWINLTGSGAIRPQTLAENVILLLAIPRMPTVAGAPGSILADSGFVYDSRSGTSSDFQKNQLPPAMEVIMVAIDEASAQRLADEHGSSPPLTIPSFSSTTSFEKDLADFREDLDEQKVRYIILRSIVTMRAGRWSHES